MEVDVAACDDDLNRSSDTTLENIFQQEHHWRTYVEEREFRARARLLEKGSSGKVFEIPKEVYERLYPHQVHGVQWLHRLLSPADAPSKGGVLADEMGLGKTVQCSAYVGAAVRAEIHKRVLVVAPGGLLNTWHQDMQKWGLLKGRRLLVVRANDQGERLRVAKGDFKESVVMTTYGMIANDVCTWNVTWDLAILDEGHTIKNLDSKTTQACHMLRTNKRLIVTGTPVMNNLCELYALFHFVDPSILNNQSPSYFRRRVSKRVEDGQLRCSSDHDVVVSRRQLDRLMAKVKPFTLRRTKADQPHLITAGKRDNVVWIEMSPDQLALYKAYLDGEQMTRAIERIKNKERGGILCELTQLKKFCDHTWLHMPQEVFQQRMVEMGVQSPSLVNADEEELVMLLPPGEDLRATPLDAKDFGDIYGGSAKIYILLRLLRHHVSTRNEKALIFSRSLRLLHIVDAVIRQQGFTGILRLDGSTKPADRTDVVQRFNDPSEACPWKICLLTTQVGGLGLTMTGASCVVLLDPSWNPAVDSQAIDRAHRIGQNKDVTVYRLITCGTIEEKIYRRQVFKVNITAKERNGETAERLFTRSELMEMLIVGNTHRSDTHVQLLELAGRDVRVQESHPFLENAHVDITNHTEVLRTRLSRIPPEDQGPEGGDASSGDDKNGKRNRRRRRRRGEEEEPWDGGVAMEGQPFGDWWFQEVDHHPNNNNFEEEEDGEENEQRAREDDDRVDSGIVRTGGIAEGIARLLNAALAYFPGFGQIKREREEER